MDAIDAAAGMNGTGPQPMTYTADRSQTPRFEDGSFAQPLNSQNMTDGDTKTQDQPAFMPKPEVSDADLQKKYEDMNRGFTRKMQELSDQRRQLEAERQQMQAILAQQQQINALAQQNHGQQQQAREGIIKGLLGPQWENMDQGSKQVWSTIDRAFDVMQEKIAQQIPNQPSVDPQIIGRIAAEVIDVKTDQGLNGLRQQYGVENVNAYADGIKTLCKQYPGITPEQALDHLNPDIKRNYLIEMGRRQALEEAKKHQASSASNGRSFPSAPVSSTYRMGESMRETAARLGYGLGEE